MGGYKLSLQATYPAGGDASQKSSHRSARITSKKSRPKKGASLEAPDLEYLSAKSTATSRSRDAPAFQLSPPRHSTACCDGLSERRELQKRFNSQKANGGAMPDPASTGHSFRSEDSESLALWEEKEQNGQTVSGDLGWLKMPGQSPWRESMTHAVKKVVVSNKEKLRTPWRSSPVHPKAGAVDSPRLSLDRKVGSRSPWRDLMASSAARTNEVFSHDSLKSWYSNSSRKIHSGELGSTRSPASASKLSRLSASGELRSASTAASRRADMDLCTEDQTPEEPSPATEEVEQRIERKDDTPSIVTEDTRFTASAVAWDLSSQPERVVEKPRLATGVAWKIPMDVLATDQPDSAEQNDPSKLLQHGAESNGENPRRISSAIAWDTLQSAPQETPMRARGAIPFEWEDSPGKPKTIAAAAERALSRRLSKDGMEALSLSLERSSSPKKSHSMDEIQFSEFTSEAAGEQPTTHAASMTPAEGERKGSHRFYDRTTSKDRDSRASSVDRTQAGVIDLVAPSAAKFLEDEGCASPVMAPIKNVGAVPFKWEEAPGKPKAEETATHNRSSLQLPPRLAAPPQRQQGRMSEESLRNHYISKSMSAPLSGFYTLPPKMSSSSATQHQSTAMKSKAISQTLHPWVRTATGSAAEEPNPAPLRKDMVPVGVATKNMTKSRSVSEVRRTFSGPVGSSATGNGAAEKHQNTVFLTSRPYLQKRNLTSDSIIPSSPTSTLCGPDEGSLPSSNPSMSSDPGMPMISPTPTSASQSKSTSSASLDSIEHECEVTSPSYSLTPLLDASTTVETRRSSLSFRDFGPSRADSARKEVATIDSAKAQIQPCKNLSRWMESKAQPTLGTIHSPEVWAPTFATYYQGDESPHSSEQLNSPDAAVAPKSESADCSPGPEGSSAPSSRLPYVMPSEEEQQSAAADQESHIAPNPDFSARLGGRFSPLRLISRSENSSAGNSSSQVDSRFVRVASPPQHEDVGNRSPTYIATLELLSPAEKETSKSKKRSSTKPKVRMARRPSARIRVRARFLVSITKALKKFFSKCTVRRFTKKVKVAEPKLLYHVDYTLSPADFRFCKPN